MQITVDDKIYTLRQKEALMIFPHQIHSLASTNSRHVLCIFSPHLVQAYSARIAGKIPCDGKFSPDSYIIDAVCNAGSDSSDITKKGILYMLCGQFEKSATYRLHKTDNNNLLFKIFSFVETEFSGDCSLTHLAEVSGYDYSYLSRFFKKSLESPLTNMFSIIDSVMPAVFWRTPHCLSYSALLRAGTLLFVTSTETLNCISVPHRFNIVMGKRLNSLCLHKYRL